MRKKEEQCGQREQEPESYPVSLRSENSVARAQEVTGMA